MSRIITDASGLVERPHDPFWDGAATRRELQHFAQIFSDNDELLTMRADTGHIVLNYLCERFGVSKAEIDTYVQGKLEQLKKAREAATANQQAPAEGTSGPNS